MVTVFDRSETFDHVLATWRNHGENEDYRFPKVHVFEHCECEEDWHIPIAEAKNKGAGCGGSCGGSLGSSLRREKELDAEGLFGALLGEALPAWGSVSREDAAGVGGFPAGPTGSFDPLPDLPPLDGFYFHELERDCDIALAPGEEPGRFCAQSVQIDCGGIDSYYLQPPDFSKVAFYTQLCFTLSYDPAGWPAHDCKAPCITPMPCELPNFLQLWAADISLPTVVVDASAPLVDNRTGIAYAFGGELTSDQTNFLSTAKALLTTNIDLVQWAVCLACSWSPLVPDPDAIVDCVLGALGLGSPQYSLYVIYQFTEPKVGGAATDIFDTSDGGDGVIIPLGQPTQEAAIAAYATAVANGDETSAMAAAALTSAVILHEFIHLCAEEPNLPGIPTPGFADDHRACWSIQNMAAISFLWALAQRYPCLQGLACFPKVDDFYFMTSEPGEAEKNVDYAFEAVEPYPWMNETC